MCTVKNSFFLSTYINIIQEIKQQYDDNNNSLLVSDVPILQMYFLVCHNLLQPHAMRLVGGHKTSTL